MKKNNAMPFIVASSFAVLLILLNFMNSLKITVPFVQETNPAVIVENVDVLPDECGNSSKFKDPFGFPFRANRYDYCGKYGENIQWIVFLNIFLSLVIVIGSYSILSSKRTRLL